MKKSCFGKLRYCLLAVILFSVFSNSWGQGSLDTAKWRFSNPKQFGFTVMDLDFYDNNNAIAVGSDGGIAFTNNAGAKWTYGAFSYINPAGLRQKASFLDVHFVTATIAYAVGPLGVMAKSIDGGKTWNFITTPLYAKTRNINTVWFLNKDTGYIGGQHNTPDSLPKLYFTKNGGATWDSLNAPTPVGKTVVGLIANPNLAPIQWDISNKDDEIHRIEFLNDSIGYITGGASSSYFPSHPNAVLATCAISGTITTGSDDASLVWKFTKGVLTDYSLTKERLGYTGITVNPVTCASRYGNITAQQQTYKAFNIINDSLVVLLSFNNNIVVRVKTGKNDSTLNINVPGLYEKGKYELMNFPFPPLLAPSIPNPQVLLASNPYVLKRASNGKLYAPANFGLLWTSIDTGRNWVRELSLPQNQNYSANATWALDITPSGKFVSMGANGVTADSIPGGTWTSTYLTTPFSAGYQEMEFADCNNGIATGGASITVTTDGGKTWIDRARADFANLFIQITGLSFPAVGKSWYTTSVGNIYLSPDQGVTMNPMFSDATKQFNDVATVGNDSIWIAAYSPNPSTARTSSIVRSFDNGATWTSIGGFPVGTTVPQLTKITFPSKNIGYVAGTRNAVYKTIDGGTTWTDISPFPSLNAGPAGFPNAFVAYTEVIALDDNTVFLTGNVFTNVAVKRVYKSTDGGATWVDITSNIPGFGGGNLNGIVMHDANNGYVVSPGGTMYATTNGGSSWSLELAPIGSIFETLAFAPRKVPAGITMPNRKLFVAGVNIGSSAPMMEFGNLADVEVNTTQTVVNASCTNASGGSITINSTGGLSPYTYSINGTTFQSSNVFSGLTQGVKTITVKDAFCGIVTKNVTVGFTDNLVLTTNNDTTVCAGAPVPMLASTNGTGAAYAWSPSTGLSAANIANPVATVNAAAAFTVNASLNGCIRTKTVNIGIKPNPVVNAGPDHTILVGSSATLTGSTTGSTQSVLWTPAASLTGSNTYSPVATPQTTTMYTMTVKDLSNCTSADSALVTVLPYCANPMKAFTPNGDGINDLWRVTSGGCADKVNVSVFNRYGNLMYKKDNYSNDWDGTYNGKAVADGTYYFVVTFKLINGKLVELSGDVTILR